MKNGKSLTSCFHNGHVCIPVLTEYFFYDFLFDFYYQVFLLFSLKGNYNLQTCFPFGVAGRMKIHSLLSDTGQVGPPTPTECYFCDFLFDFDYQVFLLCLLKGNSKPCRKDGKSLISCLHTGHVGITVLNEYFFYDFLFDCDNQVFLLSSLQGSYNSQTLMYRLLIWRLMKNGKSLIVF